MNALPLDVVRLLAPPEQCDLRARDLANALRRASIRLHRVHALDVDGRLVGVGRELAADVERRLIRLWLARVLERVDRRAARFEAATRLGAP